MRDCLRAASARLPGRKDLQSDFEPHHAATRALHWLTALFVIAAIALALSVDVFDDDDAADLARLAHEWLGVVVLLATFVRSLWIAGRPERDSPASPLAARAMHIVLVVLLLGVPLLGWAYASAKGHPPALGGFALPALLAPDLDLAERLHDWHEYAAWTLVAAAGAHVLAALHHHFVKRDHVLRAMLTGGGRAAARSTEN